MPASFHYGVHSTTLPLKTTTNYLPLTTPAHLIRLQVLSCSTQAFRIEVAGMTDSGLPNQSLIFYRVAILPALLPRHRTSLYPPGVLVILIYLTLPSCAVRVLVCVVCILNVNRACRPCPASLSPIPPTPHYASQVLSGLGLVASNRNSTLLESRRIDAHSSLINSTSFLCDPTVQIKRP